MANLAYLTNGNKMHGLEILGMKASAFFGGGGLFLSILGIMLGIFEGEALPAGIGTFSGLLFVVSGIYFRNLEMRIKRQEHERRERQHERFLQIVEQMQAGKIEKGVAEFLLTHLDQN